MPNVKCRKGGTDHVFPAAFTITITKMAQSYFELGLAKPQQETFTGVKQSRRKAAFLQVYPASVGAVSLCPFFGY